ncbi:MAG: sensor histidine kinase [Chloroflexi bacterium]|nr:sensor histidine kinase [Chloroflexota bacterium]
MGRFKHIGIQKRFMFYMAVGLAILFAGFAFFGLRSIRRATELVYEERLNTAYTTAYVIEHDFQGVSKDVRESRTEVMAIAGQSLDSGAQKLMAHLSESRSSPFFQVTGVWILDGQGKLMAEAGAPSFDPSQDSKALLARAMDVSGGGYVVAETPSGADGNAPFVTIAVWVGDPASPGGRVVAVQTAPNNTQAPYIPNYFHLTVMADASSSQVRDPQSQYHLEVVSPTGITVLGIGPSEVPGQTSVHFAAMWGAMSMGKPTVLLHKPSSYDVFKPHVHAAVPLGSSGFYLVLEQQEDVSLALPLQLQRELAILIILGFGASFLVAWFATGRVVKPVQQLTRAARRMAEGNLVSPVDIDAQDEVSDLAHNLDAMRRKLMAASQQIEKANRELESKVKERTERLGEVLHKLMSAQEEERSRLARDLHDEQSQTLSAISVSLDMLARSLSTSSPQVRAELERSRDMTRSLLQETRRLIYDLRPSVLDDMGLEAAMRWFAETHLERNGVDVRIQNSLPGKRLPATIEVSLYRICQEAMVNIQRHSRARHAGIVLEQRNSFVRVQVWDDGQGFDARNIETQHKTSSGVGLEGMLERVRLIGGHMEIDSKPGSGTVLKVEVPLDQEGQNID